MFRIKNRNAQVAIEFLSNYGWVVLVGLTAIIVISQMGTFRPTSCDKMRTGFSEVVPVDWSVSAGSSSMVLFVQNWAGDPVEISNVSVFFTGGGNCSLVGADIDMTPGNSTWVFLNCSFGSGGYPEEDCFSSELVFDYVNMRSLNSGFSKGKIRGSFESLTIMTTTTTTSSTSSSTTTTTMCSLDSQCGLCQECSGSECVNQPNGEDKNIECPGSFGACSADTCNGAGACGYLAAGEQGQASCKRCSGSSFVPVNVADNSQDTEGSNVCSSTCVKCSAGSCVAQTAAEDLFTQCPGAFGACAGTTCNGAGACGYLSGKQTCGTCQGCGGSSFACSNVAADADTYGDCTGNCDECNGAGACRGDNTRCSGTVASCSCSGSGTAYNCQTCPDSFGACGDATCTSYACGNSAYATGTDCGGLCQSCNGAGSCINTASGSDYQNECPGSYGTCAGANCNGAGACGYLAAGQQGCGTCNYCTGSGFACSVVGVGTDPYNACTASWNGCSGSCVATGPDGNCNGASACNSGGLSSNCGSNTICSAGSCVASGACGMSSVYCSTQYRYQDSYRCNGAGSCSYVTSTANLQDCGTDYWGSSYQCSGSMQQRDYYSRGCSSGSCYNNPSWQNWQSCTSCACTCGGYNTVESLVNVNCADGIDNDCDGYADANDAGCEDCACAGTGYESKTIQGQTLYVDCANDKCWTPTAPTQKTWGPMGPSVTSCTNLGPTYPACDYCDSLNYAGSTDWKLPSKTDLTNLCLSGNCPGGPCFGGDGFSNTYFASSSNGGVDSADYQQFSHCNVISGAHKVASLYVRCERP